MNDTERDRIAGNVAAVKAQAPDAGDFIRDFHEAGMIEGLRSIEYVGPHREPEGRDVTADLAIYRPPKDDDRRPLSKRKRR